MKKLITLVCCLAAIPVSAFAGPISPETPESHIAKKRLPARHDLWIRIGRCEQPVGATKVFTGRIQDLRIKADLGSTTVLGMRSR